MKFLALCWQEQNTADAKKRRPSIIHTLVRKDDRWVSAADECDSSIYAEVLLKFLTRNPQANVISGRSGLDWRWKFLQFTFSRQGIDFLFYYVPQNAARFEKIPQRRNVIGVMIYRDRKKIVS